MERRYCLLCGTVYDDWCRQTRDGDHRYVAEVPDQAVTNLCIDNGN
jgi:hypothetical protein